MIAEARRARHCFDEAAVRYNPESEGGDPTMAQAPAQWEQPVLDAIRSLLVLPPGWNSYGAKPVPLPTAVAALNFLSANMREGVPVPSVVPTSRGTLQLEWHARGVDLEVEVRSEADISVSFEDQITGAAWDREISTDFRPLAQVMKTLATRG
jgi:hypothetical protein